MHDESRMPCSENEGPLYIMVRRWLRPSPVMVRKPKAVDSPAASPVSSPRSSPRSPASPALRLKGGTPRAKDRVELLYGSPSTTATREGSRTPAKSLVRTGSAASLTSTTSRARTASASRRSRNLSEALVTLRELCNGELQRLATEFPKFKAFADGLNDQVRDEIASHLKLCGRCRAVSSFSRSNSRFQIQAFSEGSLGTLCQSCLQTLNAQLVESLEAQKDTLLMDMADSLGFSSRNHLQYLPHLVFVCFCQLSRPLVAVWGPKMHETPLSVGFSACSRGRNTSEESVGWPSEACRCPT